VINRKYMQLFLIGSKVCNYLLSTQKPKPANATGSAYTLMHKMLITVIITFGNDNLLTVHGRRRNEITERWRLSTTAGQQTITKVTCKKYT